MDYDPAVFEYDKIKFVYVRQNKSISFKDNGKPNQRSVKFDLNAFYGLSNRTK